MTLHWCSIPTECILPNLDVEYCSNFNEEWFGSDQPSEAKTKMEKEKDKKKCLSDQPGFKAGRPPYINIWLPQPNGYSGDHPVLYLATASINKCLLEFWIPVTFWHSSRLISLFFDTISCMIVDIQYIEMVFMLRNISKTSNCFTCIQIKDQIKFSHSILKVPFLNLSSLIQTWIKVCFLL